MIPLSESHSYWVCNKSLFKKAFFVASIMAAFLLMTVPVFAQEIADKDNDGIADGIDNCIDIANAQQIDADQDGTGDLCDIDDDNDRIADGEDNCPTTANPKQADTDGDGAGDLCDVNTDESAAQSAEALQDENVTLEDLGTIEARVLPDSPLHFFKRFGRGVQEALTFDPVRDAKLKLQHANQQLSETKQMIDQKGMANVAPAVVKSAVKKYQNKLADIKDVADALKAEKVDNPEVIDRLLNDVTDKQLKQQKVLDNIAAQALEVKRKAKEEGRDISDDVDGVLSGVKDVKQSAMEDFTATLATVEDSASNIGVRVTSVMDRQKGSEFKELKNLEILESMRRAAPADVKEAISIAKKNTVEKFEKNLRDLPAVVRADKFENYVKHATSDETKLVKLLDEIKKSSGIPADVLDILEEAKEIAVRRFEEKLSLVEDDVVQASLISGLSVEDDSDIDDLIVLEDFKNRMKVGEKQKELMDEMHNRSIDAFKRKFTDTESADQAELFRKLSQQMLDNPSPKTFKLMQTLEDEVRSDPSKRAFLDQLEDDMQRQYENQYRKEGDRFMDRVATLDPSDIAILQSLDFDSNFEDRLVKRSAEKYKKRMKNIVVPEEFDTFRERFFDIPDFVVQEIKKNDTDFEQAMQFKVRKMEETRAEREREIARASLDYEERELWHQDDRQRQREDDEFWRQLNNSDWEDFDTRKQLWDEKINDRYDTIDSRFDRQKELFEQKMALDPWCDEVCKQIQLQFLEQDLRHEKERLADDLIRERNRIEAEQVQHQQNDPLYGKCDSPESCEYYCSTNPGVPGCEWAIHVDKGQDCGPGAYWDYGRRQCESFDSQVYSCEPGYYWDYAVNGCTPDPYYVPPTNFRTCGYGMFWNEQFGHCESAVTVVTVPPSGVPGEPAPTPGTTYPSGFPPDTYPGDDSYCPYEYRWDSFYSECVPRDYQDCGPGYYYDFYDRRCHRDWQDCGPGFYWDAGIEQCVEEDTYIPEFGVCPPGFVSGPADGCIPEWRPEPINPGVYCPSGEIYNPTTDRCEVETQPEYCTQEYKPVCGTDGSTFTNACYAKQAGVGIKNEGECESTPYPPVVEQCSNTKYNIGDSYSCDYGVCPHGCNYGFNGCPVECSAAPTEYCGDGICQEYNGEIYSCEQDCGEIERPEQCASYCEQSCGYENGSYCMFDNYGCAQGCSPTCDGYDQWYDQELGRCINDKEYSKIHGCSEHEYYDTYYRVCRENYCPAGWQWDVDSGGCVSLDDPSCKSECTDRCSNNSWCMYADNGCAVGCSPECPENQYYDQKQSKCVSYYDGTDCKATDYNMGESSDCNYDTCSSGCEYSDSGCPTGCYTPPTTDKCTDNGYNVSGTAACDYNACSEGCTWDNNGCPKGCYEHTGGTCGDNRCDSGEESWCSTDCGGEQCDSTKYNDFSGSYQCSYSECPSGCNWDDRGCAVGCYDPDYQCPASDYSRGYNNRECNYNECSSGCNFDTNGCPTGCMTGDDMCKYMDGWSYDSISGGCVKDGVTCSQPTSCDSCRGHGNSDSWCNYDYDGCPMGCQSSTYGDCRNNSGESACWAQPGCSWYTENGSSFCEGNDYYGPPSACDYDGYCEGGESSSSCSDCSYDNGVCTGDNRSSCESVPDCYWSDDGHYCFYQSYTCNYDGICDANESGPECGDCSSSPGTSMCNNDGSCTFGETYENCAGDCPYTDGMCGNGNCDPGESYDNCSSDCQALSCNNNGFCDIWETNANCYQDCPPDGTLGTSCNNNGYCDFNESSSSCPADCTNATGGTCWGKAYDMCETSGCIWYENHYDGSHCDDYAHGNANVFLGCNYDGICGNDEDYGSCPADCGTGGIECNYNGVCDGYETPMLCPGECVVSGTDCNYNGICDPSETMASCSSDCYSNGGGSTACPDNGYNTGSGSTSCNYSTCASGCHYDGQGCPTACMELACPDIGFNIPGTMNCDYAACSEGCSFDGQGCPSGCFAPPPPPVSGLLQRLATGLYALITLPARALGL